MYTPSLSLYPVFLSCHVFLSSHVSPSLLISSRMSPFLLSHFNLSNHSPSLLIFLSFLCLLSALSVSVFSDDDNGHSFSWLPLYTRL